MAQTPSTNPRWWTNDYDTLWNTAREDLRQNWGAPGTSDWGTDEPGVRYGYGAARRYSTNADWDDKLEAKLKEEWNDLKSGRTWEEIKSSVRRGWDAARSKVTRSS